MTIQDEYDAYLARLNKALDGKKLLASLPAAANDLYTYITGLGQENDAVRAALAFIGKDAFLELVEKNLLLIVGRVLSLARAFDMLDPQKKLEIFLDILSVVKEEQSAWLDEYKKKVAPLHDKRLRRERRKELLQQESAFQAMDRPLCGTWVRSLVRHMLPEGTKSLFLPAMARLFLSDKFIESTLEKNLDIVMKSIHAREWKERMLYHLIAYSSKDIFLKSNPSAQEGEKNFLPKALFEKAQSVVFWILNLAAAVDPSLPFLPKEATTEKACDYALRFARTLSLEELMLYLMQALLSSQAVAGNLDILIDAVSGNPKAIAIFIKKIGSAFVPQTALKLNPTIGDFLAMSAQGAIVENAIQEKADLLVYNEVPLQILQSLRLFVLSTFFDRVIYRNHL